MERSEYASCCHDALISAKDLLGSNDNKYPYLDKQFQYYKFRSMDDRAGHPDNQGSACLSECARLHEEPSDASLGMTPAVSPIYIIFPCILFSWYLVFKYSYSLSSIMRAAIFLSAFLCASFAAASAAIDAFKRVDRVLEPRTAAHHHAPVNNQGQLQKRASPYLNSATQSGCIKCAIHRPETD